jgi:hypothetical protein
MIVLLITALTAGSVSAAVGTTYAIDWNVIAGGGGQSVGASYAVHGTVGQPAVGPFYGSTYGIQAGFWYGFWEEILVFLPLVLK